MKRSVKRIDNICYVTRVIVAHARAYHLPRAAGHAARAHIIYIISI